LDAETLICPTHDYDNGFVTHLQAEQKGNTFLARVLDPWMPLSLQQFAEEKSEIDARIPDDTNSELVCGLIQPYRGDSSSIDIRPDELREFFDRHQASLIIDVREAHEFHFAQDWSGLGFSEPPENIPLTRFAGFLSRLLDSRARNPHQDVIFVCRSGNRSGKAAEVTRRLGIPNAWHIAGGIALGLPHVPVDVHDELEMEFSI
jgi:rhodanese-related sulfurtransferase